MSISPGSRLGVYEIRSVLGAGGMGEVYEAYDPRLRRRVALKVLPETLAADAAHRDRFEREAQAIAALSHPNIVAIYSVEEADGVPFLTMELVEGRPLTALIPRDGLPLERLLPLAIQLADAVSAAHARGITHRDLKPDNVLVTDNGRVKVLDFGLAKLADPVAGAGAAAELPTQAFTQAGRIVGTVAYMSPEQAEGRPVDPRSDLFAIGIILYELATGERPFKGESTASLLSAILRDTPPLVTDARPALPRELARLVRRCLEKDPARRLQTAVDLRNELEDISADSSSSLPPPSTPIPTSPATDPVSTAAVFTGLMPKRRRGVIAGASTLVVMTAVALATWHWWPGRSAAGAPLDSVAVLPFFNASGNADADYLADGLAESLTSSLAQIRQLRVVPRTLAARYQGQTVDPHEAGQRLNARAIVTGRIVQRGDRLTVQAELIDTATVAVLWAGQFDRLVSDALAMRDEISKAIAERLRVRLTRDDERSLAAGTKDAAAYQAYLKGRYQLNKRNRDGLARSIEYFQQAIDRDPSYAAAYAGQGGAYVAEAYFGYLPPGDGFPKGIAAARTAINLDDRSADAHSALGMAALYFDWNWNESEREHRRALELDPNSADAHFRFGVTFLRSVARYDDAIKEIERAAALDPAVPIYPTGLGIVYTYARRYDEAIDALNQVLASEPNLVAAHRDLAPAYRLKGMGAPALAESRRTLELGDPSGRFSLALSDVVAGRQADAITLLKELVRQNEQSHGGALGIALVYAALHDPNQAFAWLEQAYQEHDPNLVFLATDPEFDSVRADPRFRDLVRRVGIPAR